MWYIHSMEYYSALEKEEILKVTAWMNLKDMMPSEISQSPRDKYC
jgi:hypothetical protein